MKTALAQNLSAAALLAALAAAPAHGKACKGVDFPDQMQVGGTALVLNGLGLRQATAFKVDVYVAALYLAQTSADANAILASNTGKELILQFVRDVGGADLRQAWQEGFDKTANAQLPALEERIEKLTGWMADMKTGQRLTFVARPGAGIEVNVNGTLKGTIEGDDFAKAFLSIWLGAKPPNPGLKTGLLGGACR
jgi:Chalcone isomerase-like